MTRPAVNEHQIDVRYSTYSHLNWGSLGDLGSVPAVRTGIPPRSSDLLWKRDEVLRWMKPGIMSGHMPLKGSEVESGFLGDGRAV